MCVHTCAHAHTHIHTHTHEYYLSIKKNKILPFVTTWIKEEGVMLSEISQTNQGKCCRVSFICGILFQKASFIDIENRMVVARG